jgi:hypothetical protein
MQGKSVRILRNDCVFLRFVFYQESLIPQPRITAPVASGGSNDQTTFLILQILTHDRAVMHQYHSSARASEMSTLLY